MPDRGTPGRPSSSEDEYFVREDAEKKRKLALEAKKRTAEEEQKRLRDLHFMHCPKCGMKMQEMKLRGVDVDVCFSCNGIFLDQGELETLQKMPVESRRGVVDMVLNWFRPETKP